ncbi:MAG: energy transducer TonB [Verrucomicrobiales bacterium]|jgi:outer membrane biosynthesis protein TonB|nr:energy transducer TonB [Verrucomicrobiales bacterium]
MNALPLHELWEKLFPPERHWLAWLVTLALLVHIALLVTVKIKPLVPSAPPPHPPPPAALLTAAAGENPAWLDWRDPSAAILPRGPLPPLTASPRPPAPPALAAPPLTASPLASVSVAPRLPSIVQQIRDTLTAFRPIPMNVQIETPPRLSGSVVEFSGSLATRALAAKTELPQPEVDRNLQATICLLAVNALGLVENVMVDSSCDDPAVDQLAVRELANWRFTPQPATPLQWGRATVYWHLKDKPPVVNQP